MSNDESAKRTLQGNNYVKHFEQDDELFLVYLETNLIESDVKQVSRELEMYDYVLVKLHGMHRFRIAMPMEKWIRFSQ